MKYYRKPILKNLEKVVDSGEALVEWETAELIEQLAKGLKRGMLLGEECDMEDGREKWMVRYAKYDRIRTQNRELKMENKKLKDAILKLSS